MTRPEVTRPAGGRADSFVAAAHKLFLTSGRALHIRFDVRRAIAPPRGGGRARRSCTSPTRRPTAFLKHGTDIGCSGKRVIWDNELFDVKTARRLGPASPDRRRGGGQGTRDIEMRREGPGATGVGRGAREGEYQRGSCTYREHMTARHARPACW
ncbi:hypothetical protein EVAR_38799_1 [Eumeta japonica]|uniref:Uncharacterized protein n=1 Tax=Eumeta variegata TaxID=151549 RepID=A0A4C1WMP0_EUMVA|nr:hypothetical protein EVAR_38799_1 [Eumeta japonica]